MKELAIVGRGPSCKYCPEDIETWGAYLSSLNNRIDRMVVTHQWSDYSIPALKSEQEEKHFPIYAPNDHPELDITIYPIVEVLQRFNTVYIGGTVACIVALALLEGYKKIYIYGVDAYSDGIYGLEKSTVEYWLGVAHGVGTQIEIHDMSELCKYRGDGDIPRMWGIWKNKEAKELAASLSF